jgi:hypothetical protein
MRCARRRLTFARRNKTGNPRAIQSKGQDQLITGLGRAFWCDRSGVAMQVEDQDLAIVINALAL